MYGRDGHEWGWGCGLCRSAPERGGLDGQVERPVPAEELGAAVRHPGRLGSERGGELPLEPSPRVRGDNRREWLAIAQKFMMLMELAAKEFSDDFLFANLSDSLESGFGAASPRPG